MPRQAVIDASAVIRLLLDDSAHVARAVRQDAPAAPSLAVPQTVNGLVKALAEGSRRPS